MNQSNATRARERAGTIPGELAAAVRTHPWWISSGVVLAWTAAAVVSLSTPVQYESDMTINVGAIGTLETDRTATGTRWRAGSLLLENPGELGARLMSDTVWRGGDGDVPAMIYGARIEHTGVRGLRVIARAASAEKARNVLGAIGAEVVAQHEQQLVQARGVQRTMREALSGRMDDIRRILTAPQTDAATRHRLSEQIALLTAMELQLEQASHPPLTRPTTLRLGPVEDSVRVSPRPARSFAVASVAGLVLGFAMALFLRAARGERS